MNDAQRLEQLVRERDPELARLRRERDPELERIDDETFYSSLGMMLAYGVRIALAVFGYQERGDE